MTGITKEEDKGRRDEHDVYENMEETAGKCHFMNEKDDKRNKDGLYYADLVFNPLPNGSTFIIRGLDDRTIYAEVDTTQVIAPLPESDDEDTNAHLHSKTTKEDDN